MQNNKTAAEGSNSWAYKTPSEWTSAETLEWAKPYVTAEEAKKLNDSGSMFVGQNLLHMNSISDLVVCFEISLGTALKLKAALENLKKANSEPVVRMQEVLQFIQFATLDELKQIQSATQNALARPSIKVPELGIEYKVPVVSIDVHSWKDINEPPFNNRNKAIFDLLNYCYSNYGTNDNPQTSKPWHTVAFTGAGDAKTSLVVDWAIRVFCNSDIINSFLYDLPTILPNPKFNFKALLDSDEPIRVLLYKSFQITRKIINIEETEARLMFLAMLHQTLSQQRIITTSAKKWKNEKDPDFICASIIYEAIANLTPFVWLDGTLFKTQQTSVKALLETNHFKQSAHIVTAMFNLFTSIADRIAFKPLSDNIVVPQIGTKVTLVNIYDCQAFTESTTDSVHSRNMAFNIIKCFQTHTSCYHFLMMGHKSDWYNNLNDPAVFFMHCVKIPASPGPAKQQKQNQNDDDSVDEPLRKKQKK